MTTYKFFYYLNWFWSIIMFSCIGVVMWSMNTVLGYIISAGAFVMAAAGLAATVPFLKKQPPVGGKIPTREGIFDVVILAIFAGLLLGKINNIVIIFTGISFTLSVITKLLRVRISPEHAAQ